MDVIDVPGLLLIDGADVDAADLDRFTTYDPATNEPLAEVASAGTVDVERAVLAARRAFDDGPWPHARPNERGRTLRRIADTLRERADDLAVLESRDSGKTLANARNEVGSAAAVFEYYAGWPDKLYGETVPLGDDVVDLTVREPVGVVAQITPWNFPVMAAAWKLAPALAAGCTVVLKPAPQTPLTALALGRICRECGVPDGAVNVVPGSADAGRRLVSHAGVDRVAFTGSTATGSEIVRATADNLAGVSLELGGKSPSIVFGDADIARAATTTVRAAFGNAGQSCSARSRILVEHSVHDEFLARFAEAAGNAVVGNPLDDATEIGPLISPDHWNRVHGYVDVAQQEGAELVTGGDRPAGLDAGNYLAPTVFAGVTNDMAVARDEIFGPVAAVIPFHDEDDAVRIANDTCYGLNASVWSGDGGRALRVARRLRTGMVSINSDGSASRYGLYTPFGGVKKSGIGRELGIYGIQLYTEVKNIIIDTSRR